MTNNPLLTIGIPAYNRVNSLENLLKQLRKEDSSKFNILVSDDASPNDPSNMISKYSQLMPNLTYIRNEKNLGYSGNVCQIYDLTETPYIWFVCDDDGIIEGSVDEIITKLSKYNPTVAILNHTWINPYGIEKEASVLEDVIYESEKEVADYNVLMRITFLSTLIVKKALSSEEIRKTDYKNNVFIQISLALMLLSHEFKLAELSIMAIRRHVGFNYGEFFKFGLVDHLRAIFSVNHIFDNQKFIDWTIKKIPTALILYLSQKLGMFRYKGIPTSRTCREIIKYYGIYSVAIFLFIPIYYLVPSALLKLIYKYLLNIYHSKGEAEDIYKNNINRAFNDTRSTKFTEYR